MRASERPVPEHACHYIPENQLGLRENGPYDHDTEQSADEKTAFT